MRDVRLPTRRLTLASPSAYFEGRSRPGPEARSEPKSRLMNRRLFIGTLASSVISAPILAKGQPSGRMYRVAMFAVSTPFSRVFVNRMQELGYTPNQNLLFELQGSDMQGERYSGIAAGIASRHPDVVVAGGSEFVLDALTAAVGSTPIVMVFIDFD